MKYLILVSTLILFSFCALGQSKSPKALKKLAKKQYKIIKNKGGEISSSIPPIEALNNYFDRVYNHTDFIQADPIEINNCPSKSLCRKKAKLEVGLAYAAEISSFIEQKIGGISLQGLGMEGEEKERIAEKFRQMVSADISGAISFGYAYYIPNENRFDYNAYFLINKKEAKKIQEAALNQLIDDSKIITDFLDDIDQEFDQINN